MDFFEAGDRMDLIRKAPTPSDETTPLAGALPSVAPLADALPSIEVSSPAESAPSAEASPAAEAASTDKGEAQVGGDNKAQE